MRSQVHVVCFDFERVSGEKRRLMKQQYSIVGLWTSSSTIACIWYGSGLSGSATPSSPPNLVHEAGIL